jgi:hypothetical protein
VEEPFDPYVQWLGFPQGQQPANHYELLGIEPLQSDSEVISHAADCLRGRIRSIRPGPHLAEWQQLLDQLSTAKAAYDAGLRGQGTPSPAVPPGQPDEQQPPPMAIPPVSPPQQGPFAEVPPAPSPPQGPAGAIPPGAIPPQQPAWQGTWASAPQPSPVTSDPQASALGQPPLPLQVPAEPASQQPPYAQAVLPAEGAPPPGPEGVGGDLVSPQPGRRPKARSPLKALAVLLLLLAASGLGLVLYNVMTKQPAEVAGGGNGGASGDWDPAPGKEPGKAPKQNTLARQDSPAKQTPASKPKPQPNSKPKTGSPENPAPKPGPEEKPNPKGKPEPVENPKPKEKPKPPLDPAKQAALKQALEYARIALSEHDLAAAEQHLNTAGANAQSPEDQAAVERLRTLRGYLEQFWEGIRSSVAELESGEELVIGNTRIAVVEASRDRLIVKATGRLHTFQIPGPGIPPSLVTVLADRWFAKKPSSKVFLGAFLAVDPKGDRQRARQLWEEASRAGVDLGGLFQELDQFGRGGPSGGSPKVQKAAPPADGAKIKQAKELIRQTYQKEYDRADTPVEKPQLARKLLEDAPGTNDNPTARYVMFREARDLAIAAGRATVACEAIDGMARFYAVDPLALKLGALGEAAEAARTLSAHKEVAQSGLALVEPAIEAKRLDEAVRLAKLAVEAARKARSAPMLKEAISVQQRVETLKRQ